MQWNFDNSEKKYEKPLRDLPQGRHTFGPLHGPKPPETEGLPSNGGKPSASGGKQQPQVLRNRVANILHQAIALVP
jgi:hypothetical protein